MASEVAVSTDPESAALDEWVEIDADMCEPSAPSCVNYELTEDGVVIYPPEAQAPATLGENKENSPGGAQRAMPPGTPPLGEQLSPNQPPHEPCADSPRTALAYSGNVDEDSAENQITDAALERMVADHDRNHTPRRVTEFLHENQRWYLIRWLPTSGSGDPVSGPPNITGAIERRHLTGINPTNPRERHSSCDGLRNRLLWRWEAPWGLSPSPRLVCSSATGEVQQAANAERPSEDPNCWHYGWNWTQKLLDPRRSHKHFVRRRMWVRTRRERRARQVVSTLLGLGYPESAIGAAIAEAQLVGVHEIDLERVQELLEATRR